MRWLTWLEKLNLAGQLLISGALITLVGLLDFITGYEFSFSVFYVLPIALVTWLRGWSWGLGASALSATIWGGVDALSGHVYSHPLILVWNSLIRLVFFVIITWLLHTVQAAHIREHTLARTDHLTGATNSRAFRALLEIELARCQRYARPFTLVYVDLDNFKQVNDQLGHSVGDLALQQVVLTLRQQLRQTDVVARLGGDEFALLLPETNAPAAQAVLPKLQVALRAMTHQQHWPITFSIGALTCQTATPSPDELLKMADALMYHVKHTSKDAIQYATYP